MADENQEHAAIEMEDGNVVVLRDRSLKELGWNGDTDG